MAGTYLGITVVVPLLTGHPGARYAEHAMMVTMITLLFLAHRFVIVRREKS